MKKAFLNNGNLLIKFIYLFIITCIISSLSMAKYQSIYTSSSVATVASWKIKINDEDITNEGTILNKGITLVPDISDNIVSGKIAPGSVGHFDIVIDTEGTEVSIDYIINFDVSKLPTDLILLGYGDENSITSEIELEDNTINGEILCNLPMEEKKTIRVFWEWKNVEENNVLHTQSALSNEEYKISVNFRILQKD